MDLRRRRGHRGLGVDDGGPRLVLDPDQLGGVGRLVRIRTDHRGDRLADVADFVAGERPLRAWSVQADVGIRPVGARRGEGLGEPGQIVGEEDDDPGELARRLRIDGDDPCPRVRGADDGEMGDAGWGDVVDEAAAAGDEPLVFLAPGGLTDHRVTPVLLR